MNPKQGTLPAAAVLCIVWVTLFSAASAQESLEEIRKTASAEIETAELNNLFKEAELSTRYLAALDGLEKKLAASGDLDLIVRLREERDSIKQSGTPTAHADKELVELRQKYQAALKVIRDELAATNAKVAEDVTRKVRAGELTLTKAGKVDEALALRKDGERLLLELVSDTASAGEVPFEEDPRGTGLIERKDMRPIEVPQGHPPVNDRIFSTKGRWLDPVTVPAIKQRLRERLVIGDRGNKKFPLVVVSPGSVWSSADRVSIELFAGRFVAEKARFDHLKFEAELNAVYYFLNCALDECYFAKGGNRIGPDHAAKFYFDKCLVKGSFAPSLNIDHHGIRAQFSVFQGMELPTVRFRKKQPGSYVNHPWLRIVNSRFVNCTIPASFLTLTRDCIFEGCTFIDDKNRGDDTGIIRPMEIPLYVSECKSRMTATSPLLKFIEKPVTALSGVTIPTVESISAMVPP